MPETKQPGLLANKTIIITGAAGGIGAACVAHCLQQGARFVAACDLNMNRHTLSEPESERLACYTLDVCDATAWQSTFDDVIRRTGRIDVLINNAGICELRSFADTTLEDFQRNMAVNVDGSFIGSKLAIETMRAQTDDHAVPEGSIVNVASIAANTAMAGGATYCGSKAALANMTKALAIECAEKGEYIRLNSVHPGMVKTAMSTSIYGEEFFNQVENFSHIPLQDFASPEDIAQAIAYLASDQAQLITGTELTVDGGLTTGLSI